MQDSDLTTASIDPVSNILKWVLLVTAILCFALLGWATVETYDQAPPHPQAFTDRSGNVIMSADDIVAGKGGFQKADLMDYGSIYGMGSYFGEDYTGSTLARLGVLTKQGLAGSAATPPGTKAPGNKSLATSGPAGTPPVPTTPEAASPAPRASPPALREERIVAPTLPPVTFPETILPEAFPTACAVPVLALPPAPPAPNPPAPPAPPVPVAALAVTVTEPIVLMVPTAAPPSARLPIVELAAR